ncbi:transposase domain-containing protein [Gemmata sp. JC717]|uniref:transposase domain-containing protein n=1 Tax=Gemmata algarum TaxID=2975278 RepID=UPI0028E0A162|nr:transposase domain-containing protein [Gemmata algarum]MDY3554912.1 transposase domain-containing protein [Gemmata algarum]
MGIHKKGASEQAGVYHNARRARKPRWNVSTPNRFSQWPTRERIGALKQLLPREMMAEVVAESNLPSNFCRRLPNWFLLWFVVAIGLFGRDSYR